MTIDEYVVSELERLRKKSDLQDSAIRELQKENNELKEQLESAQKYADKRQTASTKMFTELEEAKAGLKAIEIGFIHDDSLMVFSSVITSDNPGFKALHEIGKDKGNE